MSVIPLILVVYKDGSCSFDRINCSLVIPINRQMQSDGDSDVYFDVELILLNAGDIK